MASIDENVYKQVNKAVVDGMKEAPGASKELAQETGKVVVEGMKAFLNAVEKVDTEKVEKGMKNVREFVESVSSPDTTKKIAEGMGKFSESLTALGNLLKKSKSGEE